MAYDNSKGMKDAKKVEPAKTEPVKKVEPVKTVQPAPGTSKDIKSTPVNLGSTKK